MADRYQDRPHSAGQGRGGDPYGSDRGESDPLAELARLIGQSDPFGATAKTGAQVPQRPAPRQDVRQDPRQQDPRQQNFRQDYHQDYDPEDPSASAGPPGWMQRANYRRDAAPPRDVSRDAPRNLPRDMPREIRPAPPEDEDYQRPAHPLYRYSARPQHPQADPYQQPQADQYYQEEPAYQHDEAYAEPGQELDPARYDEALYGKLESGLQDFHRAPAYPDDPYGYQGDDDEEMEEPARKRRGLPLLVVAVMALGVFGVAAAYGYRTYFSPTRHGEPPIIKADNSPTKIVPAPSDGSAKLPDRLVSGDGMEKIVPREEQPVDVNSRAAGPRVVFPPLNQSANPTSATSAAPSAMPPTGAAPVASNGTVPNGEPRKIRTFSVRGDQPDSSAVPVNAPPAAPGAAAAKTAPAAKPSRTPPTLANASANGPISLAPQGQSAPDAGTRVASTTPTAPDTPSANTGSGGYLVQISSQKSETDAQASFRAMQNKFPSVLGSQSPFITRVDLGGEKGVVYRSNVGPFGTSAEAAQFCTSYKSAGGQCYVVKN